MSVIGGVEGSGQTQPQTMASAARDNAEVNKTDFMALLVAQLQNQDPLNPVQNQDFIAQLATFSSLEQLISVNEGMTQLSDISMTATVAVVDQLNSIKDGIAQIAESLNHAANEEDAAGGDAAGEGVTGTEG